MDELTNTARAIGAINTISMKKGKLTGENTDANGFLRDLERAIRVKGHRRTALVLGAGGAARAVVCALLNDGWRVSVAARRPEQALALTAQFPGRDSRLSSLPYHPAALRQQLPALTLLVNTTPVGMSPHVEASPWPAGLSFPGNGAVYDLVYDPGETRLVRDARAAGLPAVTGLGMLVEQAALAFEFWTGCIVERESLYAAMEEL
jgi:shikimate dehydrogenase